MKKISYLMIAVLAIGCTSKKEAWQLNLPLHYNTNYGAGLAAQLPDSVRDKRETRAFLFEENNVKVFLLMSIPIEDGFPVLITVDKNGNQVDSLVPFENPENNTEGSSEDITVLANKTILAIDTTYAVFVDELGNVDDTKKAMSVTQKTFKISATGEFERIEEKGL